MVNHVHICQPLQALVHQRSAFIVKSRWAEFKYVWLRIDASSGQFPGQTMVSVSSKLPLEVTIGLSLTKALRVAQLVAERATAVARDPPSVSVATAAENSDLDILGVSTFVLQNQTGTGVDFWLSSDAPFDSPPRRKGRNTHSTSRHECAWNWKLEACRMSGPLCARCQGLPIWSAYIPTQALSEKGIGFRV